MMHVLTRGLAVVLVVAGSLALGGCAGSVDPVPEAVETVSFHTPTQPLLQSGDSVRIVVFGREDLSRSQIIGEDGQIFLTSLGAVQAAGLTPAELEQKIAEILARRGVQGAQVSVLRD